MGINFVLLLHKYFPLLTDYQIQQLVELKPIYTYRNERINLISRKDIDNFYIHHVLHSLSLYYLLANDSPLRIIDIGCGGGFPGVPLAICFPQHRFTLIDSIGKKIKVVNEVCQSMKIDNIKTIHNRAEEHNAKYDMVISRAVAELPKLIQWTKNYKASQLLALKGGDVFTEMITIPKDKINIENISDRFKEVYFQSKMIVKYKY